MKDDFADLVARMSEIAEAVNAFSSPEVQREAFSVLIGLATTGGQAPSDGRSDAGNGSSGPTEGKTPASKAPAKKAAAKKATAKKSPAKKSPAKKQSFSQDKTLDFVKPSPSLADFVATKAPSNAKDKTVVVVYWLRNHGGAANAGVDQVYTSFKHLGWPIPADLVNTLQQAGSAGLLDTADRADIELTTQGENRVEHDLPVSQ